MSHYRAAVMLGLAWLGLSAPSSPAQVSVDVVLDHEQFLRDESLPVEVRITNRSGQDLELGAEPDWLTFTIESRDGHFVQRIGQPPVSGEFTLESSMVAKRRLDLMPYFNLGEAGRYTVTARVKLRQWGQELASKPALFDITRGTRIWEQPFGVPAPEGEGAPEVRRYVLLQANNLKHLMLYLRLADPSDTRVFRVLPLGQLVSFSRPEAQVDKHSNLHVLFQTGARSFLYYMISPAGNVLVRQTHDYAASRPGLKSNVEGKIFVTGGVRRRHASDVPASPQPSSGAPVVPVP